MDDRITHLRETGIPDAHQAEILDSVYERLINEP